MSVTKYRSVYEMPSSRRMRPLDGENIRLACDLSELAYGLRPWRFEPGVRRFRNANESIDHRRARSNSLRRQPESDDSARP